ncbi:LCP family protein required for cell wall assembly [Paenibacillus forsythiae]|uniref:LCP family protein required for cell wall assembly n=1 Tax=Paenibacillus forsythiae TaxID=365616 RepID=A0ABU3HEP0_9BACL|nr:LCP family protein [Paenibacillus forsythiae]MDT3428507.1 LCP family protein required for cell wall assembly [Paenibacillus forsythiae]
MPPRSKRHAKKGNSKKTLIRILLILLLLLALGAAYFFTSIYQGLEGMSKHGEDSPFKNVETVDEDTPDPPKWEGTEPVNILLMGVDARGVKKGEIPRSDTMLVASLNPVTKKAHVFSILRDTYVSIPGHGQDRINSAIIYGPNTAMETVSDLLGIPIQYYVYTDFQGFIKLVDAVGGIDYTVEKDMVYKTKADGPEYDIDLKKGYQHLDGNKALQYVRFRHDATSDYTRTQRQRAFLSAVADKLKSTTALVKLPSILSEVSPYIDTNLSINDMWKLANVGYGSSMAGSEQIPPMKLLQEETVRGQSVLGIRSLDELKRFVEETMTRTEAESSPSPSSSPSASAGSE